MRRTVTIVMGSLAVAVCVLACSAPAPESTPAQPPPAATPSATTTPSARPAPADTLVAAAVKDAKAGGKAVLIEFGASWCT